MNFGGPGVLSWNLWLVSHQAGGWGQRAQQLAATVVGKLLRLGSIPLRGARARARVCGV